MSKKNGFKLTLIRSLIGRKKKHLATIACLRLRKMHQTVEVENTPVVRGMIDQIGYLLKIEEC